MKKRVWPKYRPVAHLWAAFTCWWDTKRDPEALGTRAALREFLMIAKALRRAGEAFKPKGATAPILDAEETWKVRPEVSAEWPHIEVRFDDPEAWDLRRGRCDQGHCE